MERESIINISYIQNCGYKMPKAFIKLEFAKCQSNFVTSILAITKHWVFICPMDVKKISL
jgi:hypothetical protein